MVRLSPTPPGRRWPALGLAAGWTLLLVLLPWWLGLPLLLAPAAALLIPVGRLAGYAPAMRRGLRWGLPGWLVAVRLALGAGPRAWVAALLLALAAFSLLMLLENWLDRGRRRTPSPSPAAEWRELAMAPVGPPAVIIEVQPPAWREVSGDGGGPQGARHAGRTLTLADGVRLEGVEPRCATSPDGRWLAAPLAGRPGLALRDCRHGRTRRLRGWQLYGWQGGQPWLSRGDNQPPQALAHVLGQDPADGV